ncbi:PhzF family phenazine biosynthesis protein [Terrimonas pollutisoli]|uniref:PhzF family phenazine biosynthesis protein n=1 Tax=Terrimonas pollutisoli TaxID=3034147 RepID=UPI0023EB407A|nr:PhzF family phenazine biosynthesis protein [Terrimonas sp. H1YJ31]
MKLKIFQVDAFADKLFGGNPAAVVPLKKWLPDDMMQQLAMENNLAETVFFAPSDKKDADYDIRWFTPAIEINLCGHATLASAFVLFDILKEKKKSVTFNSKSGLLTVRKKKDMLLMDFPSWKPEMITDYPSDLKEALGVNEIVAIYKHRDILVELNKEEDVQNANPDFTTLKKMGLKVIITAPGKKVDFVSRFFAPVAGIDEDPVTGSAHSQLIPFWSEKTAKKIMQARQLSQRGGDIYCEQHGDRVIMGGQCVFYMQGEIIIPAPKNKQN